MVGLVAIPGAPGKPQKVGYRHARKVRVCHISRREPDFASLVFGSLELVEARQELVLDRIKLASHRLVTGAIDFATGRFVSSPRALPDQFPWDQREAAWSPDGAALSGFWTAD